MPSLTNYSANSQYIVKAFSALFGAGVTGDLVAAGDTLLTAGTSKVSLINTLMNNSVVLNSFPLFGANITNEAFAGALLDNLTKGSGVDATTLAGWKTAVAAAIPSYASRAAAVTALIDAVAGYTGSDANLAKVTSVLNNRAEVGAYAAQNGATTFSTLAALQAQTANVDTTAASVTAAQTSTAATGSTFTLTVNADNILGGAGADTIGGANNATQTTFSAIDSIDGGAGIDTLNLDLNATYTGGATIKNIEKINLTSSHGNFNAVGITGLTDFNINAGAAAVVTNLSNVVNVGVSNVSNQVSQFNIVETAVSGSADAVKLTLNNVTAGAGNADIDLQTSTALGAGIETVNIVSTGVANAIRLGTNDATVSKITVTGDKNLTLTLGTAGNATTIQTSATTIDATGFTGALNVSGLGIANHAVTGGSGNDTINFAGNFAVGDTVDGGAGTDTLAVTQAITAAQWAGVKNVEAVSFTAAGFTQDASLLTGVNTFTVSGAGPEVLNKLSNNADVTVSAATTTLTASLADATGLTDALKVQLNPSSGTTANFTLGTLSDVTGLEQLNLVANGSSNAVVNTITNDSVVAKHVVTGTGSLTITNAIATSQFDATGLTGNLTATAAAGGSNIQGGSGNDVLTGGAAADVLVGGAGNDRIVQTAAGAADTLKGGAGADTFVFSGNDLAATLAVGAAATATVDSITDFVAGTDKIALVNAAASGTSTLTVGATVTLATAADIAAILTGIGNQVTASNNGTATAPVYSAATIVVQAGAAAGTYLFVNDATLAAANTDLLVNITGVTGTITASDFVFA